MTLNYVFAIANQFIIEEKLFVIVGINLHIRLNEMFIQKRNHLFVARNEHHVRQEKENNLNVWWWTAKQKLKTQCSKLYKHIAYMKFNIEIKFVHSYKIWKIIETTNKNTVHHFVNIHTKQ